MQNEEWNVSAVSLSPELVRLAQQKHFQQKNPRW